MPRLRILATATTFPRWKGDSSSSLVFDLENRLGKMHDITVLAPHHPGAKKNERMGALEVRRFAYFKPESLEKLCYGGGIIPNMGKSMLARLQLPLLVLAEFFSASGLIREKDAQIIHAHWMLPQGMVGALLKGFTKKPLIITIHGSDLFPIQNVFLKKLQGFAACKADIITVNSEATGNELLRRFPHVREKVRIIPMGVDTSFFRPRRSRKPKSLRGKKIILFVGRLSDQKGVQYLVEAMPSILSREKDALLFIIGEGPHRKELEALAGSYGMGHAVRFLGGLPQEKVAMYHGMCDVFVLPALANRTGTEALGLALLEAMASGCAVVGTDVGGIPSAVSHGKTGILVRQKNADDLAASITALLKNRKKASALGRRASSFISRNYSWEQIAKKFDRAYRDVAS